MARQVGRLTALTVSRTKSPGLYPDGDGLYLQVTKAAKEGEVSKSWIYRYMLNSKAREMGLGALSAVGLADARKKADEARGLKSDGLDPIETKREGKVKARLEVARAMTFRAAAEAYIEANKESWRNPKHADQWSATLEAYAYPAFGSVSVQQVDVALVLKALEPIWKKKTETAARLRGRIEAVLDWATARGYRLGENPARWRGHLNKLLAKPSKLRSVKHHPALPYPEIGGFMVDLRAQEGIAAKALEFLILTTARTSEVIGATWDEIDLKQGIWIVPLERIKARREHRVPLSAPALAILKEMAKVRDRDPKDGFVFAGRGKKLPLSNMAMLALLKRMERDDLTAHGFRSTFRDWAAEQTNFPNHVVEMALAHAVGDKVEAAYRRGDLFQKRRLLMDAWAKYCAKAIGAAKVIELKPRTRAAGRKA